MYVIDQSTQEMFNNTDSFNNEISEVFTRESLNNSIKLNNIFFK